MHLSAALLASSTSATSLLPRMFFSMAVVIGLMWLAARIMKNRQVPGSGVLRSHGAKHPPPLQVLAKQGMGGKSSVAIIRAGDKELVVGISDGGVTLLTELQTVDLSGSESLGANANAETLSGDLEHTQLKHQGTGASEAAGKFAAGSTSSRKGLIESVRELTVRK